MIEPDFTLPRCSRELAAVTRPLREGLGKLLIAARRLPPQLAVYHSMPSVRAAYALGLDVEQADQLKGIVTGLHALGVPFVMVDGRQVEKGWLAIHRPRAIVLTMALAMSDRELEQLENFVREGGRVIVDAPPAVFDERLQRRPSLPPGLMQLLEAPGGEPIWSSKHADELLTLPEQDLWQERGNGAALTANKLAFARYYRDLAYRTCPEIRRDCERCEAWLEQAVSWASAQPIAQARWEDGTPVRDCLWAGWELDGGRLVAVLRQSTATDTRTIRVDFPPGTVVYDVLSGRRLHSPEDHASMEPGAVALWAVLSEVLSEPRVNVVEGSLAAGQESVLDISVPNAPDPMVIRLEIQAPRESVKPIPESWLPLEPSGELRSATAGAVLPGLSRNLLLTRGQTRTRLALPSNLPEGSRLVVKHWAHAIALEVNPPPQP